MKNKIFKLALLLPALAFFISCEYKTKPYEGDAGIYFDINTKDTIPFTWIVVADDVKEYIYKIRVTTLGRTANYDRPFEMEIVDERDDIEQALPNVDYKPFLLTGVIPANKSTTDVEICLLRNPDYFTKGATKVLTIHLKENEHFKFLYNRFGEAERVYAPGDTVEYIRYRDIHRSIKIDEIADRQIWWKLGSDYRDDNHLDFGKWSAKKSLMLCDYYEFDRVFWLSGNFNEKLTPYYITFMGRDMARVLEAEKAAGRTVYEVDGITEMRMGPNAY